MKDYIFEVFTEDTYAVTGYSGDSGIVVIPPVYQGKSVTAIGEGLFEGHAEIKKVLLPAGLTYIGSRAFAGTGIEIMEIPGSVENILPFTFKDCRNLGTIVLRKGVKNVFSRAFEGCGNLVLVAVPSDTEISHDAFTGCSRLNPNVTRQLTGSCRCPACTGAPKLGNPGRSRVREFLKRREDSRPPVSLICIGTALVDSIIKGFDPEPISASGFRAESGSLNAGGEAVNESMAAAKLGVNTAILCSLGNDSAGDLIIHALEQCGVDTSLVLRSQTHETPVTTMFVADDGTRKSITNSAHKYNFRPDTYTHLLAGAKGLILGSLFRAPFDDPEIIHAVVSAANKNGQLVFADTKLPNFRRLSLDDIRDTLPLIDYITPNEDEARYYTGMDDPEKMADAFLAYGVKNVIIKLGPSGCLLKNAETCIRLPACPVDAVDATGAGDNFIAGFASEILRGASAREALTFANTCGAICTTAVGAGTALKSREQVLSFM